MWVKLNKAPLSYSVRYLVGSVQSTLYAAGVSALWQFAQSHLTLSLCLTRSTQITETTGIPLGILPSSAALSTQLIPHSSLLHCFRLWRTLCSLPSVVSLSHSLHARLDFPTTIISAGWSYNKPKPFLPRLSLKCSSLSY